MSRGVLIFFVVCTFTAAMVPKNRQTTNTEVQVNQATEATPSIQDNTVIPTIPTIPATQGTSATQATPATLVTPATQVTPASEDTQDSQNTVATEPNQSTQTPEETTTAKRVICAHVTPCAWSLYNPKGKFITDKIENSAYCFCSSDTICQIVEDDTSAHAYIHRCRPPGIETGFESVENLRMYQGGSGE